jgi:hypothetical protein
MGARSWSDPAGSGPLAESDKVPSRKKIKILDLTRRRTDDVLRKEKAMRPKKKDQWFRHDEGNAKELKSQLEWKISLIVRQRVSVLEKKIAAMEKSLQDMYSWLSVHTKMEPERVQRIIHHALTPPPASKTLTIYPEIKPRRPRKKKK